MQAWWIAFAAAIAAFLFARPLARLGVAAIFARRVSGHALAAQPDAIHLEPATSEPWLDPADAKRVSEAIAALGFEDAGTFTIPELPDVTLQLLAHPESSTHAAVYQHRQAGSWFEFFQHQGPGAGVTFTSLPRTAWAIARGIRSCASPAATRPACLRVCARTGGRPRASSPPGPGTPHGGSRWPMRRPSPGAGSRASRASR
ncbi:MAG: hypothetical protein ABI960_05875 [Candidatus Eisenbacteria bacterium]